MGEDVICYDFAAIDSRSFNICKQAFYLTALAIQLVAD